MATKYDRQELLLPAATAPLRLLIKYSLLIIRSPGLSWQRSCWICCIQLKAQSYLTLFTFLHSILTVHDYINYYIDSFIRKYFLEIKLFLLGMSLLWITLISRPPSINSLFIFWAKEPAVPAKFAQQSHSLRSISAHDGSCDEMLFAVTNESPTCYCYSFDLRLSPE